MEINEEYDIDTLHPQIYQYVVEEIPRAVESYRDEVSKALKIDRGGGEIDFLAIDIKKERRVHSGSCIGLPSRSLDLRRFE